jgi:hypothetical protein
MESGIDTKGFLGRILIGALMGQSPEEFAKQEVRRLCCGWCADGWPFDENGQHDVLGIKVDCETPPQRGED